MAYTFLSWYRRGLASQIAAPPAAGGLRVKMSFKVDIEAPGEKAAVEQNLELAGPADVTGFNMQAVIRTEPADDSANFEWAYMPFVEFYDEDIPWRFTPEPPDGQGRLRPWAVLFVLKSNGREVKPAPKMGPFPAIQVTGPMLAIPPEQSWAWAHVQVTHGDSETDLKTLLQDNPDRGLSRIFCPRRLEPQTAYEAYLVPAFESGRKAGLGETPAADDGVRASWETEQADTLGGQTFPFYYRWTFSTDSDGDFESLARRLQPWPAKTESPAKVSLDRLLWELGLGSLTGNTTSVLEMPTLLAAFSAPPARYVGNANLADQAVRTALADWLDGQKTADGNPVLAPICGARYHQKKTFDAQKTDWVNEINLDPRYRALAALGASVVRKHQDKWIEAAKDMTGDLDAANQRLRQAQFAATVGTRMYEKHLQPIGEVRALSMTKRVHQQVQATGSKSGKLGDELQAGLLTGASTDPAFRKMLKQAQRRVGTKAPAHQVLANQINDANKNTSAAKIKRAPYPGAGSFSDELKVSGNVDAAADQYIMGVDQFDPKSSTRSTTDLTRAMGNVKNTLDSAARLLDRVNSDYGFTDASGQPAPLGMLDPIQTSPAFREAIYSYFVAEAPQFVFPRLVGMPANSVTLLQVNQAVVEAFLTGMNDEMGREFRWRQFPADARATYFANFWDTSDSGYDPDDITHLDSWGGGTELGKHRPQPPATHVPELFLVFKGDMFRKFNNAVVYLTPAVLSSTGKRIPGTTRIMPILRGTAEPDLLLLGFSKTKAEVQSGEGYYLAIEERAGVTRLGLDAAIAKGKESYPVAPADLSWLHLKKEKEYADVQEIDDITTPDTTTITSSSDMASVLYQQQFCVLIHLSNLMPKEPPLVISSEIGTGHLGRR